MVALFLRLKLQLLLNSFRRSPWQVVGLVVAIVYGLGVALLLSAGLIGLRFVDAEDARTIVVLGGSVALLGFLVVPLVFGVDDTIDPRRFALYGIDRDRLATGLAISALIGVPALALVLVSLASIGTWTRDFGSTLFAIVSAAIGVATCVLAARVTTSLAAFLLSTRRSREIIGIVGVVALVALSPTFVLLSNADWGDDDGAAFTSAADVLSWTPLGAVWAVPGDIATGRWGTGVLHLLIAVATGAALWFAWRALVAWMLVTPARESNVKSYGGLGWFSRLPATPTGAIAARSATYWIRDPRYRMSLIMIPIVPVLLIVPLAVVGTPASVLALLPVPVMSLFLGWAMHNDVAYDNTAIWLHVVAGVRGKADRLGRLFPVLVVGLPIVVLGSVISAIVHGEFAVFGGLVGVGSALLLSGVGFSNVTSARFPYPVVRPGDNPFSQPQSTGATTVLVQSITFFASSVLAVPAFVFAALGMLVDPGWYWASLAAGIVIGGAAFWGGLRMGSIIFERRGPEILGAAVAS